MMSLSYIYDRFAGSSSFKAQLAMTCVCVPVAISALGLAFMSRSSAGSGGSLSRLRKISLITAILAFFAYLITSVVQLTIVRHGNVSSHLLASSIISLLTWRILEIAVAALVSLLFLELFRGPNARTDVAIWVAVVAFSVIAILQITLFGLYTALVVHRTLDAYIAYIALQSARIAFAVPLIWLTYAIFLVLVALSAAEALNRKRTFALVSVVLAMVFIKQLVDAACFGLMLFRPRSFSLSDYIEAADAEYHIKLITTSAILVLAAMFGTAKFRPESEELPKLADEPEVRAAEPDYRWNPVTGQ